MNWASRFALSCMLLLGFSTTALAAVDDIPEDDEPPVYQPPPPVYRPPPPPPPPPPPMVVRPLPPPPAPVVARPIPVGPPFLAGYLDLYGIPWALLEFADPTFAIDEEGQGFGAKTFLQVLEYFVFAAEIETIDFDDFETEVLDGRVGGGLGLNPTPTSTIYALVDFVGKRFDFDPPGPVADVEHQDGVGMHIGFKAMTARCWGAQGQLGYLSLEDLEGPEFQLGFFGRLVPLGPNASLGIFADYRTARLEDDSTPVNDEVNIDEVRTGLRFNFQSPRANAYPTCI